MKYITTLLLGLGLSGALSAQFKATPIHAFSPRPAQPGLELRRCYDGDVTTGYESNWGLNAIPDTVDFFFGGVSSINKIEYVPRASGLNGIWRTVSVYARKANTPFVKIADLTWANDNVTKVYNVAAGAIDTPACVRFIVTSATGMWSTCNEINFWSPTAPVVPVDCANPATGLPGLLDQKQTVTSASVSPASQPGEGIERTLDNNVNTLYTSSWAGGGFPMQLTYNFGASNRIDYVLITPRQDGNINGRFGDVEIWYKATSSSAAVKAKSVALGFTDSPTRIDLPAALVNIHSLTVKVLTGGNNFASCAEMAFFSKNTAGANIYSNLFDSLYSKLKPGVTQAKIDTISMPFFKSLAQCLFNGTYDRKFRYQSYKVYPNVGTTAAALKTSTYNSFENPTGIAFKANDKAVLFVGPTHGVTPSLRITDFGSPVSITDQVYPLKEGLNLIDVTADGLAYISYYNDNAALPDIRVHIATGRVNGYYDPLTDTDADWNKYLTNQIYPSLDIKGKYVNMAYHKSALLANSFNSGKALVQVYDSIVKNQYILMGLFKYNRVPKNHMFTYSEYKGGWYAGGWGAHFDLTWGEYGLANADGVFVYPWGIAHEFGHVNQVRPGFKWTGTTEVTNNLYSTWCEYTMGSTYPGFTRLEVESVSVDDVRPDIIGGRINGGIWYGLINKRPIMTNPDVFKRLILFWQLQLYYQAAGASKNLPTLQQRLTGTPAPGGNQPDVAYWLADMLEKVRTTDETGLSTKQLILNCMVNICDVVKEDLTDFFVKAGLLVPINEIVGDYSSEFVTITQQEVNATIAAIKAKNYPAPASPVINYISANSVNSYRLQQALTGTSGIGATLSNNTVTVDAAQWQHAVAFETYKNDTLVDVAIFGTGSSDRSVTKVFFPDTATAVFAIGYNGEKKLVYPATLPNQLITGIPEANGEHANIKVYPNPTGSYVNVTLNGEGKRPVELRMTDITGTLLHARKALGGETIQLDLSKQPPGMYFVHILSKLGVITKKVIKQ
ncbi:M60 family metallopeptidase [Chitinophaga caseinilytica]|uniref:M60 family metallopeptidase n=1 Tax=Chitinophaga caseinilytica TaxID=2267521 RepID=A0ABZ2Z8W7_9BACT